MAFFQNQLRRSAGGVIAPFGGIAPSWACSTSRGFHSGQLSHSVVDVSTRTSRSFQQHQGDSPADNQKGRGIRIVGTDQWQV